MYGARGPCPDNHLVNEEGLHSFERLIRVVHRTPSLYIYSPNLSTAYFLIDLKSISSATTSTHDIPNQQDVYVNSKSKARKLPLFLWQSIKLLNFGPLPPILPIYSSGFSIYRCGRFIPALRVQGRELTCYFFTGLPAGSPLL